MYIQLNACINTNYTKTIYVPEGGVGVGVGETAAMVNVSGGRSVDDWDDPAGVNWIAILCLPTDNPLNVVPLEPLNK